MKDFNRTPNAFEKWYLSIIQNNKDVSGEMVYYGLMTSNEYRYY